MLWLCGGSSRSYKDVFFFVAGRSDLWWRLACLIKVRGSPTSQLKGDVVMGDVVVEPVDAEPPAKSFPERLIGDLYLAG